MLLEQEGAACKTLESLGVTLENATDKVEEIAGKNTRRSPNVIPFTARAKKVFELGLREALALGQNYIETQHLLLGLVREAQSAVEPDYVQTDTEDCTKEILQGLGVELDQIKPRMQELFPDVFGASQELPKNRPPSTSSHQPTSVVIPRASRADVKALVDEAIAKLGEASELLGQDVSFDSITTLLEGASYSAHGAASLSKRPEWFPPLTAPLMPPLPPQGQDR